MREGYENTLLSMIREHNRLNGFWFVAVEFLLVTLAALFIAVSGVLHGRWWVVLIGVGIAANAAAVLAIAVTQIRAQEPSEGLWKLRSSEYRAEIAKKYPRLSSHTSVLFISVLMPLLLVVLLSVRRAQTSPKKPM